MSRFRALALAMTIAVATLLSTACAKRPAPQRGAGGAQVTPTVSPEPSAPQPAEPKQPAGLPLSALRDAAADFSRQVAARGQRRVEKQQITEGARTQSDGKIEITFAVDQMSKLNYLHPEDLPGYRGRLRYWQERGSSLSADKQAQVQRDLTSLRQELQGYIDASEHSGIPLKVSATLGPDGLVVPGSLQVWFETYKAYISGEEFLARMPGPGSEAQQELQAYQGMVQTYG